MCYSCCQEQDTFESTETWEHIFALCPVAGLEAPQNRQFSDKGPLPATAADQNFPAAVGGTLRFSLPSFPKPFPLGKVWFPGWASAGQSREGYVSMRARKKCGSALALSPPPR